MSLYLYELHDKYEFIKDIIYKYNELGFYTFTSQPGHSTCLNGIKSGFIRKQRAYIKGYMDIEMSKFILSKLSNRKEFHVRDELNNSIIDYNIECIVIK